MAQRKISAEDTSKLRELNQRVKGHLSQGDYGQDSEADCGIADPRDREMMRRSTAKQDVSDLTSHIDSMLDTENPNPDGD